MASVSISGKNSVSITPEGMSVNIDGPVSFTYDRKRRVITFTGLDWADRVVQTHDPSAFYQGLHIELA